MTDPMSVPEFRSPTSNPAPACYWSATQHVHHDCGWVSPPCPDTETALDFWGDHIMAEDTKGCE